MEDTFSFDEKDKEKLTYLYKLMSRVLKPHPWHGIPLKFKEYSEHEYNAFIEIVPSDSVKYEMDKITGYLRVDRPQKFSNIIPALYGFIPQTYCSEELAKYTNKITNRTDLIGDGDALDICVLTEKIIPRGDIMVTAIPIGGLRMIDNDEVDDKIIAVLKDDSLYGDWKDIGDCPESILNRLRHYFLTYKEIPGQKSKAKVEITHTYGVEEAKKIIELTIKDYQNKYNLDYLIDYVTKKKGD
ncbi:MAG: inorganic pyrophosphatase [Bdellovibrionota bacterium]|nr:inorganic pyrophosphatase [Bdellovibrionota bacterium]